MRKAPSLRPRGLLIVILSSILGACGGGEPPESGPATDASRAEGAPEPVVVYSARAEQLIKPIFDAYTAETGIPIRYTTDSEQPLIQKLLAEGETTPADLLMTVDAGNLW